MYIYIYIYNIYIYNIYREREISLPCCPVELNVRVTKYIKFLDNGKTLSDDLPQDDLP